MEFKVNTNVWFYQENINGFLFMGIEEFPRVVI